MGTLDSHARARCLALVASRVAHPGAQPVWPTPSLTSALLVAPPTALAHLSPPPNTATMSSLRQKAIEKVLATKASRNTKGSETSAKTAATRALEPGQKAAIQWVTDYMITHPDKIYDIKGAIETNTIGTGRAQNLDGAWIGALFCRHLSGHVGWYTFGPACRSTPGLRLACIGVRTQGRNQKARVCQFPSIVVGLALPGQAPWGIPGTRAESLRHHISDCVYGGKWAL